MTYFDELICSGNSFPTQPKGDMNLGNGNLYGEIFDPTIPTTEPTPAPETEKGLPEPTNDEIKKPDLPKPKPQTANLGAYFIAIIILYNIFFKEE